MRTKKTLYKITEKTIKSIEIIMRKTIETMVPGSPLLVSKSVPTMKK